LGIYLYRGEACPDCLIVGNVRAKIRKEKALSLFSIVQMRGERNAH